MSKGNGYLIINHLYYYVLKKPNSKIIIKASDPYGHTFTSSISDAVTKPIVNYAHYYEREYKEYKKQKDKMLRDSVVTKQKDTIATKSVNK